MIIDTLENSWKYCTLNRRFAEAFHFLQMPATRTTTSSRTEVDGHNLFALASRMQGKKKEEAKLEAHKKYIDIQCVFGGVDTMGWKATKNCVKTLSAYDEEKDITFYDDEPTLWYPVASGMFVIFFPEDAHAPMVSDGEVRKVIMKVAV